MFNLAGMYEQGRGVAQDRRAAARHVFDALRLRDPGVVETLTAKSSDWSKDFHRELQRLMKEAGVYDGDIDGLFGPGMRRAIEALTKTGKASASARPDDKAAAPDLGIGDLKDLGTLD